MALPAATWNGQTIVTTVARFGGLASDSTSRAVVTDHINLALWEISLHTPWSWNETTNADITVVAGTASYNLPTGAGAVFEEPYSVRLVGSNERTLDPIDRRNYDKVVRGEQDNQGVPTHYFIYAQQQGATITLVPTPSVADLLRIRFLTRQTTISDATASSLAVPDRYMPVLIAKSVELIKAWKTPEEAPYWQAKFERLLQRATDRDRVPGEQMPAFSPAVEHQAYRVDYINPDDLTFYPRG